MFWHVHKFSLNCSLNRCIILHPFPPKLLYSVRTPQASPSGFQWVSAHLSLSKAFCSYIFHNTGANQSARKEFAGEHFCQSILGNHLPFFTSKEGLKACRWGNMHCLLQIIWERRFCQIVHLILVDRKDSGTLNYLFRWVEMPKRAPNHMF